MDWKLPETDPESDAQAEYDRKTEPEDDIADLSTPGRVEKFAQAKVRRGRPKAGVTKASVPLRLDPDVVERFKSDGPGWQSRVNAALRKVAGLVQD